MTTGNSPLLLTKLNRPRLTRDLVRRLRLLERLDHSLNGVLTLVCAPAGFGKTTLVSSWVEEITRRRSDQASSLAAAWLNLDQNDSDLTVFVRYLVAAIRTIFDSACPETLALIQGPRLPSIPVISAALSNGIEKLPGKFILVLDDFSAIRGEAVHDFLNELLRHWPQAMHLVMIARSTPPLPMAELRLKGLICEVRSQDLRFDKSETAVFLEQAVQVPIRDSTLELLDERIEGWVGGLRLAALSVGSRSFIDNQIDSLSIPRENFSEYFLEVIFSKQLPAIQKFLLNTSILDRFCIDLCEAVPLDSDQAWQADAILDRLLEDQLFIIPLDDRNEWFRYHHIFQDFLKLRLSGTMSAEHIRSLHCRAAIWYGEHGLIDQALQHAFLADDLDLVTRLMAQGLPDVLNREDRQTLERWLRLLPGEYIESRPELLLINAFALQFAWQHEAQMKRVRKAEAMLDDDSRGITSEERQILQAQILVLKGQESYFKSEHTAALAYCSQAHMLLPENWAYLRSGALFYVGLSMYASRDKAGAERILLDSYQAHTEKFDTYALRMLMGLALISLNSGDLETVYQNANTILARATANRLPILQSWGWYLLGVVHYHRNDLDAAAMFFSEIVNHPYTSQVLLLRESIVGFALINWLRGATDHAWQSAELLAGMDLEQTGVLSSKAQSLAARLRLLDGDREGALRWAEYYPDSPVEQPLTWLEEPHLTRARILLAGGTSENVNKALQLLDALANIALGTNNSQFYLEVLTQRALALFIQGSVDEALTALQRALEIGRQGGFVRVFIELGLPLEDMLRLLVERGIFIANMPALLEAIPGRQKDISEQVQQPLIQRQAAVLVEPLTRRELEILKLLREPISIKQAALKLGISPLTAKRHTINIYAKLDVNARWDAVARAAELGLLSSS